MSNERKRVHGHKGLRRRDHRCRWRPCASRLLLKSLAGVPAKARRVERTRLLSGSLTSCIAERTRPGARRPVPRRRLRAVRFLQDRQSGCRRSGVGHPCPLVVREHARHVNEGHHEGVQVLSSGVGESVMALLHGKAGRGGHDCDCGSAGPWRSSLGSAPSSRTGHAARAHCTAPPGAAPVLADPEAGTSRDRMEPPGSRSSARTPSRRVTGRACSRACGRPRG